MKYLISTAESYRFSSESEATDFIESAKQDNKYILSRSTVEYKERKQKGEVIDFWWKVTLVKKFGDEKEPTSDIDITYTEGRNF